MKPTIMKNIPKSLRDIFHRFNGFVNWDSYFQKSWSQEGEDFVLFKLFDGKDNGFYIDVGAHHPLRFSNTYKFYKLGWRGINIDAMPDSMDQFKNIRPRDINIEKPISDRKQILTYYAFNEPAYNSFSKELADKRIKQENCFIEFTKDIETNTLEDILDKYLPSNQLIDFLTIDVEGLDFQVIKSNNFEKYRPNIILIEILDSNFYDVENSKISNYLKKFDYSIFAKTVNTVFFIENKFHNKQMKQEK